VLASLILSCASNSKKSVSPASQLESELVQLIHDEAYFQALAMEKIVFVQHSVPEFKSKEYKRPLLKIVALWEEEMKSPKSIKKIEEMYRATFKNKEFIDILNFYKSEAGLNVKKLTPKLAREVTHIQKTILSIESPEKRADKLKEFFAFETKFFEKNLSTTDLASLNTFGKTPSGVSFLNKRVKLNLKIREMYNTMFDNNFGFYVNEAEKLPF